MPVHRQQPGTARGVVFLSLEDEAGMANIIIPPQVGQRSARSASARAPCSCTAGSSG
jgi:error-prone DNA polymerase